MRDAAGIYPLNGVSARSINAGEEFGIKLKTNVKILAGDVLESFEEKIKQKTLNT